MAIAVPIWLIATAKLVGCIAALVGIVVLIACAWVGWQLLKGIVSARW